jgi:hypothetical protein
MEIFNEIRKLPGAAYMVSLACNQAVIIIQHGVLVIKNGKYSMKLASALHVHSA